MDAHLALLRTLLSRERDAQRERDRERRSSLPLHERVLAGLALDDLEIVDDAFGLGGRVLWTLAREPRRPLEATLGVGAPVSLRARRAHEHEAVRAVVVRLARDRLTVAFDRTPPAPDGAFVLELLPDEVTFERATAAIDALASEKHGRTPRHRAILLGERPPGFGALAAVDEPGLNGPQRDAIALAEAADELALIHGPPGTGKSTVLAAIVARAVSRGEQVLCAAASNTAVDRLAELAAARGLRVVRLGHPARVADALQHLTLEAQVERLPDAHVARALHQEAHERFGYASRQRRQGRSRDRFGNAREAQAEGRRLLDEAHALERRSIAAVLDGAQVLAATLTGCLGRTLGPRRFPLAVVDEATQAIEPLAYAAFLRAERVVLAGDPLQLGPTVIDPEAARDGLGTSLFQRLLTAHGEGVKRLLTVQHRMHEGIMRFPSARFYEGKLCAHPSVAARLLHAPGVDAPPLLFLDTSGKAFFEDRGEGQPSLHNVGEAALVVAHARALLAAGVAADEVAVITPYAAQAAAIGDALQDTAIEVDTVDAFQGREKEAILVSLVRSNDEGRLGFLEDLRRLNVALTRAKRHLFVVGDAGTLARHEAYDALVRRAQEDGGYRTAWEWPEAERP